MVSHKIYAKNCKDGYDRLISCRFEGWFLFGFIPLYTRQIEFPKSM